MKVLKPILVIPLISFPWSMIDKITPRPDPSVRKMLKDVGFEDVEDIITSRKSYVSSFVNAEESEYLIIEDNFPNGRPALEEDGIIFTDRATVEKVEKMKVCTALILFIQHLQYLVAY